MTRGPGDYTPPGWMPADGDGPSVRTGLTMAQDAAFRDLVAHAVLDLADDPEGTASAVLDALIEAGWKVTPPVTHRSES